RRGLAGAVGPEQREDFSLPHLEGEFLDRADSAAPETHPERLRQALGANLRFHAPSIARPAPSGNSPPCYCPRRVIGLKKDAPAIFGALVFVAFFASIFDPSVQLYYRDTARLYYAVKLYVAGELHAGRLPLWDRMTECGVSLLGQVTPGLFHPAT